ncbi:MAG: hypothetical protein IPP48_12525 [Chitinophagaceae bacterium]|nr:hypothetical protein [Chitinophagaceae bacterium]
MTNKISEKEILESLNGLQKAEAPAFFYTRLKGRMQQQLLTSSAKKTFAFKPLFVVALLCVVLTVNIFSLVEFKHLPKSEEIMQTNKSITIETFANAYNLDVASVYQ